MREPMTISLSLSASEELIARVRALIRRSTGEGAPWFYSKLWQLDYCSRR